MCPILGAGFAPISGNMRGSKRGEGRHCRPSPELGARAFYGARTDARGHLLLDLDTRNLDVAGLGNRFVHVIGELDGVQKRLGFFLVLVEVRDEDVNASRFDVGKEHG